MQTFNSPRTALTPEVVLAPDLCTFRMTGECYPEDPRLFFGSLLAALACDDGRPPARLEVSLELSYVNSASTMWLRRLLVALDALAARGTPVHVTWRFDEDDDVALELGRDVTYALPHLLLDEERIAA